MAAPSGIVWGSIVTGDTSGRKGRLGIYKTVTNNSDYQTATVSVEVWFWTIYSCSDTSNTLYYDGGLNVSSASTKVKSNVSISHKINSGSGWNTANQTCVYTATHTITRTSTPQTVKLYAKLSGIDMIKGTVYVDTTCTIDALARYTVSYDLNGANQTITSQTQYCGMNVTLATPSTRNGYSFKGWATSASGSPVYSAGQTYSSLTSVTLYAIWSANTFVITFNPNGGGLATVPQTITKTYDVSITLPFEHPTRERHIFRGWSTSSTATTATYSSGTTYTGNTPVTLYAVWELAYTKPRVHAFQVERCDQNGNTLDDGVYALVTFKWEIDEIGSADKQVGVSWTPTTSDEVPDLTLSDGISGEEHYVVGGSFDIEKSYTITVNVGDGIGETTVTSTLSSFKFPIDVLAGGNGVAFGKAAEPAYDGVMDVAFDANFRGNVYGTVPGMGQVTRIPVGDDIDDYRTPGCYAVYTNADANPASEVYVANCPRYVAGRLEVWSSTGAGDPLSGYTYIRQVYRPFDLQYGVVERDIMRYRDNEWQYSEWKYTTPSRVVLFSGDGNRRTVTLTSHVSNLSYLEIYYRDNNYIYGGSVKVPVVSDPMCVDLSITEPSSSSSTIIRHTRYTISGSVISPNDANNIVEFIDRNGNASTDTDRAGYTRLTNGSTVEHIDPTINYIYITKVVGYYE